MLSLSPRSGVRCSWSPGDPKTKTMSVLRVVLLFALAGCSAEDETAPPSQAQAPTIVVQPSVVVLGLGARISATLRPNGIDTDCYFEYGPTDEYGRRLATKFIQAKLTDVVVSDTIANLGIDTTYHCRLVATNAAGTMRSTDRSFSVANAPPTIVTETLVTVAGPKTVVLTATVNANNRSAVCYFEYGQTTSYGARTISRSIGAGGTGVVVRDTIRGLTFDSTYHCRLVADNAAGKTGGSDQSFMCSSADWATFAFPLDAGTTWQYAYSLAYQFYNTHFETRGHQVWRSAGPESATSIRILVTRIDTTITYPAFFGGDTTTVIAQADTSFSIIVTSDSLCIGWYHLARDAGYPWLPDLFTIPRLVDRSTSALTRELGRWKAVYVSGRGLTFWEAYNSSNMYLDERLTLESVSP